MIKLYIGFNESGGDIMRIAICDDEEVQRELILKCVKLYFKDKQNVAYIEEYESAEQLLFNYNCNLDIVLLDIQMKEMDGITLARELRKSNEGLAIIFITGVADYIFEGFEVKAINYLMKPFDEYKLKQCLDKAVEQCGNQEKYFTLKVDKELIKISKRKIIRVESQGHYINIITGEEQYRIKKSMKEIESELQDNNFFKMSRSDLVNIYSVEKITSKEVELINGDKILIPKGKHGEVSEAFMNCHFRKEQF